MKQHRDERHFGFSEPGLRLRLRSPRAEVARAGQPGWRQRL